MEFRKITNENIWDVVKLQVKEDQRQFVANNTVSLLEAYATQNEGGKVEAFAIYEKDTMVGFVMINFDVAYWEGAPAVARNNYCLWRFMIDQHYQGQGLGKKALAKVIDYVKTMPLGQGDKIYLSYVPGNKNGAKLYEDAGFAPNGEMDGPEIVLVLDLK